MPKQLSQAQVDSDDDSSRAPSPQPKASKSKKRAKVESESDSDSAEATKDKKHKKKNLEAKPIKKPVNRKHAAKHDEDEDEDDDEASASGSGTTKSKNQGNGKKSKSYEPEALVNDKDETYFDLGGTRRATVRKYRNNIQVDIRETYSKDGQEGLPGKKGISLSLDQFDRLKKCFQAIDAAIDELA
ncbi:hypothetical protein JCM11491_004873 [Sporobolomyces phaffii]